MDAPPADAPGEVFTAVAAQASPTLLAWAGSALVELGLADLLAAGATLEEAAARSGLRRHRLRALLEALTLDGTVSREGARFRLLRHPAVAPPLGAGWGRLGEALRRQEPLPLPDGPALERYHQHLLTVGAGAARALARRLADQLADGLLVDVGGGAGAYTAALLDAAPRARALLIDEPAVIALARDHLGAEPRVTYLAGSFPTVTPTAGSARVVLLANLLHLYDPAAAALLVAAAAAAAAPGGLVVVKDLFLEPDRRGPSASLLFALNMALYTDGGEVHEASAIVAWLEQAGLPLATVERSPDGGAMVIVAARPGAPHF